jgi:hypothetical protein
MKLSAIYFLHIRINPWRDTTQSGAIYAAVHAATVSDLLLHVCITSLMLLQLKAYNYSIGQWSRDPPLSLYKRG